MQINKNVRLFLSDVYDYDIAQCHYQILQKLDYDISKINREDKKIRNIQIGVMIKNNPRIGIILRKITNSIISNYLLDNKVSEYELILRQYDGVMLTRYLEETESQEIPIILKNLFCSFISSINRNSYISFNGEEVFIKGVPYRYKTMDLLLEKIARINFSNKSNIFKQLQKIKDELFNSMNPKLFAIPSDDNKHSSVFLKKYGETEISNATTSLIDVADINKNKYFDFYIRPFTESIVIEFL